MIADGREADAPPVDQLAEAVCLSRMLFKPSLMDSVNLGPMLVSPQHRVIWQVMARVRMQRPDLDGADFFNVWAAELRRRYPHTWDRYYDLIQPAEEYERGWQEYEIARDADPDVVLVRSTFDHSFRWWADRVSTIHQARSGLSALQRLAEELWRAPDRPIDPKAVHEIKQTIDVLLVTEDGDMNQTSNTFRDTVIRVEV